MDSTGSWAPDWFLPSRCSAPRPHEMTVSTGPRHPSSRVWDLSAWRGSAGVSSSIGWLVCWTICRSQSSSGFHGGRLQSKRSLQSCNGPSSHSSPGPSLENPVNPHCLRHYIPHLRCLGPTGLSGGILNWRWPRPDSSILEHLHDAVSGVTLSL